MQERFFYKVEYPHEWSNGYDSMFNENMEYISSLEEARELAIKEWRGRWGESRHRKTSYGVIYDFEDDELVDGKPQ